MEHAKERVAKETYDMLSNLLKHNELP